MTDPHARLRTENLAALMERRAGVARVIMGIAGEPGAGKSTLAEALVTRLNRDAADRAAVLPMDGYHLDDAVLEARGLRARKGAPETFDVAGLAHMLRRLRSNEEAEIAVPIFDRDLEIARAGARIISSGVRHVVVEGNYLLLDLPPWSALRPLFDLTVMVCVPEDELRQRLIARWRSYHLPEAIVMQKVEGNDLPNARLVREHSAPADVRMEA
jgi:pantothenate kinase